MSYFKNFPTITHNNYKIKDISIRLIVKDYVKRNLVTYETIYFNESNTLEQLAYDYYGNSNLHWIIMLVNDIVDPFYDLPLSQKEIKDYTVSKYNNIYDIHHYELSDGSIVPEGTLNSIPVTNLEYEEKENEKKRNIKIIDPSFIKQILTEQEGLLNGV